MKIWFDILTPKHLLFFEPMITRLRKNHQVFCTSRNYRELVNLSKNRKLNLIVVGQHGGAKNYDKLKSSISRMKVLSRMIKKQRPDLVVSFCSPEASRIAYGLGIKHIAFSDSPHAEAVMRLSVPLVQRLLTPWVIPKDEFVKFGINPKNIIQYKAIDAAITLKREIPKNFKLPFRKNKKKTILVRVEEDQAAYLSKNSKQSFAIIKSLIHEFGKENIVIIGRYSSQIKLLKSHFGKKAKILTESIDGKALLENADVFIGSGGTMTAESALLGIPTISYFAVPNFIGNYLISKKLVISQSSPQKVVMATKKSLQNKQNTKRKAKKILSSMEDPYTKLVKAIKSLK